jgi:predicted phage tail protein
MQNTKPVNIFLEGKLGKLFGRKWSLCVASPAEALQAININTKGKLKEYLLNDGAKKFYKVALQKKDNLINPKEEIKNPSGQSDIYFIPTIKGASSGTGKIIAGVVLIIVGVLTLKFGIGGYLITAGIGMILGGVVQLMTPVPKMAQPSAEVDQRQSYGFQGYSVTIFQGSSVGIVYGKSLVAPMPISASMENIDIGRYGGARTYVPPDPNELDDGSTQYGGTNYGRT